jgi:hypothetical protein
MLLGTTIAPALGPAPDDRLGTAPKRGLHPARRTPRPVGRIAALRHHCRRSGNPPAVSSRPRRSKATNVTAPTRAARPHDAQAQRGGVRLHGVFAGGRRGRRRRDARGSATLPEQGPQTVRGPGRHGVHRDRRGGGDRDAGDDGDAGGGNASSSTSPSTCSAPAPRPAPRPFPQVERAASSTPCRTCLSGGQGLRAGCRRPIARRRRGCSRRGARAVRRFRGWRGSRRCRSSGRARGQAAGPRR